jgi:quinol monooxygenase YgiN
MTGDAEVIIVARYLAASGNGDLVAGLLRQHGAASRAEPGCREFTVLRGAASPEEFILVERYASEAAFEAHRTSPHFESIVRDQIRPLLADRAADRYQSL